MKSNEKTTYVTLEGLEKAKKDVEQISAQAIEDLEQASGEQRISWSNLIRHAGGSQKIRLEYEGFQNMILEQIKGSAGHQSSCPLEELEAARTGDTEPFLIEKISHTGGHLASNLGVVELTIALYPDL